MRIGDKKLYAPELLLLVNIAGAAGVAGLLAGDILMHWLGDHAPTWGPPIAIAAVVFAVGCIATGAWVYRDRHAWRVKHETPSHADNIVVLGGEDIGRLSAVILNTTWSAVGVLALTQCMYERFL